MDCLKAQTCITSYVEGKLSGDELKEFLIHMEHCAGCKEELEIYYTLLVGTKQLDEGTITTFNFSKELDDKIHDQLAEIRHWEKVTRRITMGAVSAGLFLMAWAGIILLDIHVPVLNPVRVTWQQERTFIEKMALPYMFDTTHDFIGKGYE